MAAAPALLAFGALSGAHAQSASEFRLQPSTPTPPPDVQGPFDPDNPVATRPSPNPAPAPQIAVPAPALPRIEAAPVATPPQPGTPTAEPTTVPAPTRTPPTRTTAGLAPLPSPTADLAAPPPVDVPVAASPVTALPTPAPQPAPVPAGGIAWWWLIPAVLLGGLIGWALLRRREAPPRVPEIERPRPATTAEPAPEPEAPPAQAPLPDPPAAPAVGSVPPPEAPLELSLEPVRMSVTLVNATLHYQVRLTNKSAAPLGPIALAIDMIAAHASRSDASLLAQDGAGLELCHEVPMLAPGESTGVSGQLRLPLAEVAPIRSGPATLFVPLVRLRVEAAHFVLTRALVIGQTPAAPGGRLRPFRLDQGPRIFGAVSQRELAAA